MVASAILGPDAEGVAVAKVRRRHARASPGAGESYESVLDQRATVRASERLSPAEREELEYLWGSYSADMGIRSVHGAIEDRLRRSPPRDEARRAVLDELERAGGRAPEGKILRIVVADGGFTRYEVRRAIQLLELHGKVDRVAVASPPDALRMDSGEHVGLTDAQREWTGFDLREQARGNLTMRLALRSTHSPDETRAARWRRQDEAIERELHTLPCSDDQRSPPTLRDEPLAPRRRAAVDRATAALAVLPSRLQRVLWRLYGGLRPEERARGEDGELLAIAEYTDRVRSEVGYASPAHALRMRTKDSAWLALAKRDAQALIVDACKAYRIARRVGLKGALCANR